MEKQPANKSKSFEGVVVSDKMEKSVMVRVIRLVAHEMFDKRIRLRSKFMAHNEKNEAKMGDKVLIVETRPMSRNKRWRVAKIIKKSVGA